VTAETDIRGHVDPGFGPVADAFADVFVHEGERGAAVAVVVDGRTVVDLVGGTARDEPSAPWLPTTIVNAYSVVKPLAAACVLLLVDRGLVDLDERVTRCWPEFRAAGKEDVTVRQLLAHQAGLDLVEQPPSLTTLLDWAAMTRLLAASAPRWPPGTAHGEHATTYGHLVGELVCRVDGRSLGAFMRAELAGPWGMDFHVGLSPREQRRAASLVDPDRSFASPLARPPEIVDPAVVNGAEWRAAEIPAINGHGTAVALARFYAGLAAGGELDGVRLLSRDLAAEAIRPQLVAVDRVLEREVAWGLGPQIDLDEGGFGLGGMGGSLGWWSEDGYALGYVTRRLGGHERADMLDRAVRDVLA
jgi:CubicO group peptidase (beta-lactamase class C family)